MKIIPEWLKLKKQDKFMGIGKKFKKPHPELSDKEEKLLKQEVLELCEDTGQPPQNIIRHLCKKMGLKKEECYKSDQVIMGSIIGSLEEEGKLDWDEIIEAEEETVFDFMEKPVEEITAKRKKEILENTIGPVLSSMVHVPLYKTVKQ